MGICGLLSVAGCCISHLFGWLIPSSEGQPNSVPVLASQPNTAEHSSQNPDTQCMTETYEKMKTLLYKLYIHFQQI